MPIGIISRLQEDEHRFYIIAVLNEQSDRIKVAIVEWKKVSFEEWWKKVNLSQDLLISEPSYLYTFPSIIYDSCTNDTWDPTFIGTPSARDFHTAVWTGTEMIIWGGYHW